MRPFKWSEHVQLLIGFILGLGKVNAARGTHHTRPQPRHSNIRLPCGRHRDGVFVCSKRGTCAKPGTRPRLMGVLMPRATRVVDAAQPPGEQTLTKKPF